jgi:hypothetical protein
MSLGVNKLADLFDNMAFVQGVATKGIDFDKLSDDKYAQTITYTDENGAEQTYQLNIPNFNLVHSKVHTSIIAAVKNKVFTKEKLQKNFGFGGKYGEFKTMKNEGITEITHPDNWFDKLLNPIGDFIEHTLTV